MVRKVRALSMNSMAKAPATGMRYDTNCKTEISDSKLVELLSGPEKELLQKALGISPTRETPDDHGRILHDWLKEDGSDGEFHLLYESTRDGLSAASFHSKCDSMGCTLSVIETTDGIIVGGYTNASWENSGLYKEADKAFLFALSGPGIASPFKMKVKSDKCNGAICDSSGDAPVFGGGHDLCVRGSNLCLNIGHTYELGPSGHLLNGRNHKIKDMKVFQVGDNRHLQISNKMLSIEKAASLSKNDKESIHESLQDFGSEILFIEKSFLSKNRKNPQEIITLNVGSTTMATTRRTLQLCKDSSLASSQFSFHEEEKKSGEHKTNKEWDTEDVAAWLDCIEGLSKSVMKNFE